MIHHELVFCLDTENRRTKARNVLKTLVVGFHEAMVDLFDYILARHLGSETTFVATETEALRLLEAGYGFDLIILDLLPSSPSPTRILQFLQKSPTPLMVLSKEKPDFGQLTKVKARWLKKPFVIPELINEVISHASLDPSGAAAAFLNRPKGYVPISLRLLRKLHEIPCALFIRINELKFVKMTGHGVLIFDDQEMRKYQAKGVSHLFIDGHSADDLIHGYRKKVMSIEAWQVTTESDHEAISLNVELLKGLSHYLGWDQEMIEVAKHSIQKTMHLMKSHPGLQSILFQLKKIERFGFADHCTLTLLTATGLLKNMGYDDETNLAKMAFAAVLHDMNLSEKQYEHKKHLIEKISKGEIDSNDARAVFLHPQKNAETARSWDFCPPEVDEIIYCHHELPNGQGFPRGLSTKDFAFLPALFVVAEDFANFFIAHYGQFHVELYLSSRQSLFDRGHFKTAFRAIETALLTQKSETAAS